MKSKLKNAFTNIFKAIIAIGLTVWLIQQGKFDLSALKQVLSFDFFILLLLIIGFNTALMVERWRVLLATNFDDKNKTTIASVPSRMQMLKLTLMGYFFNFAMPGGVGGDLIKGFYLAKQSTNRTFAVISILVDRIIGLYCMLLAAVLVMILDIDHIMSITQLKLIFYTMSALTLGITVFFALAWSHRIQKYIQPILVKIHALPLGATLVKVYEAISSYRHHKRTIILAGVYSVIGQGASMLLFYFVGVKLGIDLNARAYVIVPPIGFIVTALPLTPGGVGVGQTAFLYLFNLYKEGSGVIGTTAVTLMQLGALLYGLVGAYYFVLAKKHLNFHHDSAVDINVKDKPKDMAKTVP